MFLDAELVLEMPCIVGTQGRTHPTQRFSGDHLEIGVDDPRGGACGTSDVVRMQYRISEHRGEGPPPSLGWQDATYEGGQWRFRLPCGAMKVEARCLSAPGRSGKASAVYGPVDVEVRGTL